VGYFAIRHKGEAGTAHRIVPVLGAVVTVWVLVEASTPARMTGLVWLVAGLLAFFANRRR
jgi:L-aminopeptidase/D-esterase-like protein